MKVLFNDTLRWLLKRRLARIEAYRQDYAVLQQQQFTRLIQAGKHTQWGQQFGYKDVSQLTDFQRNVPISTYEDLVPYIERMLAGEAKVLWPSRVHYFSKSSGTTNARSKFIPVSQESLDEGHFRAGKDLMALWIRNQPETRVFEGKGLSIGGSLALQRTQENVVIGDISAVVMQNLPSWAQYIRTPSLQTALMDDWEEKILKMAIETSKCDVTSILGVPTWTVVLIKKILEITGENSILNVWPNLELFCHGAVAFQPYRELFKSEIFGTSQVRYLETYNASEGFFGLQDDLTRPDELLLMLDYGIFYEFIPVEQLHQTHPDTVPLEGVEIGKNYAMLISTNAGLWRYKIGDTVRFTSKEPYRIKISGRTKHFINAFGEEVIIENAEAALTQACERTHASITDYTAAPVFMQNSTKGRHEWVIEFAKMPYDMAAFTHYLDEALRNINSDYDAKRSYDLALLGPVVHAVADGTFYAWMKQRGKLGGQHKVPRLCNTREYVEGILAMPEII